MKEWRYTTLECDICGKGIIDGIVVATRRPSDHSEVVSTMGVCIPCGDRLSPGVDSKDNFTRILMNGGSVLATFTDMREWFETQNNFQFMSI